MKDCSNAMHLCRMFVTRLPRPHEFARQRWELIEQGDGTWDLFQRPGGDASASLQVVQTGLATFQVGVREIGVLAHEALAAQDVEPAGTFRAFLFPEGVETSDDRYINEGALFWRDPPLPLMLQTQTDVGHFGAELAGSILTLVRENGGVWVEGTLDNSEAGEQAVQILTDRDRFGISGDLGEMDIEYECTEIDGEGFCVAERMTVTRGEVLGGTMTPFPAFAEAYIELASGAGSSEDEGTGDEGDGDGEEEGQAAAAVLVAAGIPTTPPAEWFEDPGLEQPTPMTVEDSGRVYGHAALWNTCHVGRGDTCLIAPRTDTDYAYFRVGEVQPAECDCENIATGVITMATGHASIQDAHAAAFEHYGNSGHAAADVVVGEDEHGIWFSGALRPQTSPEQIRELRGSVLSGDWRRIGGNLELIALLAVNTPGYPVPRPQVRLTASAAGQQSPHALVAAGAQPLTRQVRQPLDPSLERRLARLENIAEPLRGQAAQALLSEITGT